MTVHLPDARYEAGIDLRPRAGASPDGSVHWRSFLGTVHLSVHLDGAMKGHGSMTVELSRDEWQELKYAGDRAFEAQAEYRKAAA